MSEQRASYNVTYPDKRSFKNAVRSELRRLTQTDAADYRGPEPSLVRALFEDSGWQQSEVASLLRVNVSTVRRWTASTDQAQSRDMPFSAWALLLQVAGHTAIGENGGLSLNSK